MIWLAVTDTHAPNRSCSIQKAEAEAEAEAEEAEAEAEAEEAGAEAEAATVVWKNNGSSHHQSTGVPEAGG